MTDAVTQGQGFRLRPRTCGWPARGLRLRAVQASPWLAARGWRTRASGSRSWASATAAGGLAEAGPGPRGDLAPEPLAAPAVRAGMTLARRPGAPWRAPARPSGRARPRPVTTQRQRRAAEPGSESLERSKPEARRHSVPRLAHY